MAEKQEGYDQTSQQYLAAVWYAMRNAQDSYQKHLLREKQGVHMGSWGYLSKIRKALKMEPAHANYAQMRADLLHFAETFGVEDGNPNRPITKAQIEAQKEFST